jgi:type VI protein secretion system component Hcp
MTYTLKNCIVTSYSFHGNAGAQPQPSESVTFSYTDIEWKYQIIDPESGQPQGNVVTKYSPAKGA